MQAAGRAGSGPDFASDRETVRTAWLKVNLTLHVGPLRGDGYHPVDSVCVFPRLGDRVALGPRAGDFTLEVTGPEAGSLASVSLEDNLVMRAARLLASSTDIAPRLLRLCKTVPSAGGVAGGTADAAAVLVLLNETASRPLGAVDLIALSRRLGADGPVCTAAQLGGGGAWHVRGGGDEVRHLGRPPPLHMALANPRIAVPTGKVFAQFDEACAARDLGQRPGGVVRTDDVLALARAGRNDLRGPACVVEPSIEAVETAMRAQPGCLFARMSGSGATVFGLFAGALGAARAAARLRARGWWSAAAPLARG